MRILLVSTYDLGRQPFGLASPAAWLREAGHQVQCLDVTRTRPEDAAMQSADLVAFFLPMHTATRMALPLVDRVRRVNPAAHVCAYGLYAPLNATMLRERGVETVLGPEFEQDLRGLADRLSGSEEAPAAANSAFALPRLTFRTPDRSDLPPLARYATLQADGASKVVGYTEGTRGCKHRCRHCPIVPVYDGHFRVVAAEVVMADIAAQVAAGAQHITFGDPDFFNGPRHAMAIVEGLAGAHPGLTYDVTIKVEHLLRQHDLLARLRDTGCAFVTTAVESFDDRVLAWLDKGHTLEDFEQVAHHCRTIGLNLSPTFVAFTPWTTMESYAFMLSTLDRLDLVAGVAPVQYAIRLLIPDGSRMLELDEVRARVTHFDRKSLTHVWRHDDPRVDALQRELEALAGARLNAPREEMFASVGARLQHASGLAVPVRAPRAGTDAMPYLNEPWYCCAEPNAEQVTLV